MKRKKMIALNLFFYQYNQGMGGVAFWIDLLVSTARRFMEKMVRPLFFELCLNVISCNMEN